MTERGTILELCSVTKSFGTFNAVDGIDLKIADGEFFTIVGPSGSGKTTLLRMLAGLERPSAGDILHPRRAGQRRAGEPAADLPRLPVAGALPAQVGRRQYRLSAEDPGRRRRRPASARRSS